MSSQIYISILLLLLLCSVPAAGQSPSGPYTISGTVTDQSGASVPGAVVSARKRESRGMRSATTDETGSFRITGLQAATLDIEITSGGFTPVTVPLSISGRGQAPL